jgi:hypothetical protein
VTGAINSICGSDCKHDKFKDQTVIVAGTGPSLTQDVCILCNNSGLPIYGCNNTWTALNLDVFLACNPEYYDHYWERIRFNPMKKYTWDKATAEKYGINYIAGRWADGLSTDPNFIHYHHGAGPQILNVALHHGFQRMLLVGWDMRYPGKIDRYNFTEKRHFFGEDSLTKKHYPNTGPNGEFTGLIKEMETIKPEEYGIEIINCTPNSAMTCFPFGNLKDYL